MGRTSTKTDNPFFTSIEYKPSYNFYHEDKDPELG